MTLSLGVVWAVILLAPGLAVYAALFDGPSRPPLRPIPPQPASLTTLALIVGGAAIAHLAGLSGGYVNDLWCTAHACPVRFPFNPNPYVLALGFAGGKAVPQAGPLLFTVLSILLLTAVAFAFTERAARLPWARRRLRPLLFGWLSALAEEYEAASASSLSAFVLTTLKEGDLWVGYEGEVETLVIDDDRSVAMVTLLSARSFVARLGEHGFQRTASRGRTVLDRIVLTRAGIENIAFSIFAPPI